MANKVYPGSRDSVAAQIFCFKETVRSLEEEPWTATSMKGEDLQSSPLQRFAKLLKRGKFQHFYGLMGKRASGDQGEMFIGLMGRRSSSRETTQDWDSSQPRPMWEP
ncbi:uncharacterized protein LOC102374562 isoform X2 [Alligator sinensis]|uniref:Uncharacterized protein LOC102374562 isoform X2 n=1 Tax=Alligator sinensis TaxID=38654 RepID=A0A1U7S2Q9_ALLSI|nr:uncharacterized protein LOC102374562 isoform X2 [Alligator sinensis]